MGPHSRTTLDARDYISCDEFSVWVSSWQQEMDDTLPIVAERSMYFDYGNGITGGHQALGVEEPWFDWYFAEGYTGPGFDEYICIYNPGWVGKPRVTLDLTDEQGEVQTFEYLLPESGRITVKINDLAPGKSVSAHVKAVDNVTIVAERSMYFNYAEARKGGSVAPGSPAPATRWYFAEGYAGN
ncbi:MAG: hypothetical protein ACYC99_15880 [Candidatus Geothermincolia bacterium]